MMTKQLISLAMIIISASACTTVSELESAPACSVWEERPLAPRFVQPRSDLAKYEGRCHLFNLFWCEWLETDIDKNNDIYVKGSNGFESRRKFAQLNGQQIKFDASIFDVLASSGPAQIDAKSGTVSRTVTVNAVGLNKKVDETLRFNNHCNSKDAAIGAITLWMSGTKG